MPRAVAQLSQQSIERVEIIGAPRVADDRVTLRIRVEDGVARPVMGLQQEDFSLRVNDELQPLATWVSPRESVPPPAWIIILLDMSGSMRMTDARGGTRLEGAIGATREFLVATADRGGDTQVAIVPFGEGSGALAGCAFEVSRRTLDRFYSANDVRLANFLDNLAEFVPCASTNLYDPLTQAVRFFNSNDPRFALPPEDSGLPEPRLSVILLSDGYDNAGDEERRFAALGRLLEISPRVTVHTIGYGEQPRFENGQPVSREDVEAGLFDPELYLDEERLEQIARQTGGLYAYTPDRVAITESLLLFLDALLGEYELSFRSPMFERGSRPTVITSVATATTAIDSAPVSYAMLGLRRLALHTRLSILAGTLLLLVIAGLLPFQLWTRVLSAQEQEI